jgi:hypothetical protein
MTERGGGAAIEPAVEGGPADDEDPAAEPDDADRRCATAGAAAEADTGAAAEAEETMEAGTGGTIEDAEAEDGAAAT